MMKICTAVMVLFITAGHTLEAQEKPSSLAPGHADSYSLSKGSWELGLWGGGSPGPSTLIGKTQDRELLLFGLRYGWIFSASENIAYEYTFDLIPTAVMSEPGRVRRGKSTFYGAGLSPLGLKVLFGQQSWVKPFIGASVGFLYFNEKVPVPRASRFNLTPEISLGLEFFIAPQRAFTLGYKYHHLSNAYTAPRNPGLDSNVIYAGFSFYLP